MDPLAPSAPLLPPRPLPPRLAALAAALGLHLGLVALLGLGFEPAPVPALPPPQPVTLVRVAEPPALSSPASPAAAASTTHRPAPIAAALPQTARALTPVPARPPAAAAAAAAPAPPAGPVAAGVPAAAPHPPPYPPMPPAPADWPTAALPSADAAGTALGAAAAVASAPPGAPLGATGGATGGVTGGATSATASGITPAAARRGGTAARIDMAACPLPAYPPAARRALAEGSSRIRFQVSASGQVERAEVERSAGPSREHRLLDEAALRALSACRFQPGTDEAGRAVGAVAVVDYIWRLE